MLSMNMDTTEAVSTPDSNLQTKPQIKEFISEEDRKILEDFILLANETLTLVKQVAQHGVELWAQDSIPKKLVDEIREALSNIDWVELSEKVNKEFLEFDQFLTETYTIIKKVFKHEANRLNVSAQRDSLMIETLPLVKQVAQREVEWKGSKPVDPVALCTLLVNVATLLILAGWTYFISRVVYNYPKPASAAP